MAVFVISKSRIGFPVREVKGGFRKGDIIKSIAGVAAADYPELVRLRELFFREDGTEYIVKVECQGKIHEQKLILYSSFA